jgi:hypothetical protein
MLEKVDGVRDMRWAFGWLLTNLRSQDDVIQSPKSSTRLLGDISSVVTPKPSFFARGNTELSMQFRLKPVPTHEDFLMSLKDRGEAAIRWRKLYGSVSGSQYWMEVATGIGAERYIIPRVIGTVVPNAEGGSTIRYRIKMVQRNRAFFYQFVFGFSLLLALLGAIVLVGGTLVGLVPIALGMLFALIFSWWLNRNADVAIRLAERLRVIIDELSAP